MSAKSLYTQGYKLAVIAEMLGVSKATVSRRLKNVPNRPRVQVTAEYAQMAVQMRKEGFTWEDAAYKIGFHARTLQRAVSKYAEQGLIE